MVFIVYKETYIHPKNITLLTVGLAQDLLKDINA